LLDVYFTLIFLFISITSISDIFYYRFNMHRLNLEALQLLKDSSAGVLQFAVTHFTVLLLFVLAFVVLLVSLKFTRVKQFPIQLTPKSSYIKFIGAVVFFSAVFIFSFSKYLSPLSASLLVKPGYTGLYINSPQTFLYSFHSGWTYVKPLQFVTDGEANKAYPVFYANADTAKPTHRNVVLFILESFSYSYLDPTNLEKPSTPFFDSLIKHSAFYTRAYANNMTSANGLGSLLSGLPSLMNQPIFSSAYANNPIDAIGIRLQQNGYETHFALGANDDHFGFKKGTKLMGLENYWSGEPLPKDKHDGTWGIYDEPFLQYFAEKSNHFKQPFFATLFTISSHYPFKLPDSLLSKFPTRHSYANERVVSYVDYAFKKYFDYARTQSWYNNTIFLFTGDHVSKENDKEKFNANSHFHVPIFVFDPLNPVSKVYNQIIQHTDFPSTIASYTGIKDSVISFGLPFNDTTKYRFTVNRYSENIIQMIDAEMLLQYDIINQKVLDIYRIGEKDTIRLEIDLERLNYIQTVKVPLLKVYMQQYFNRLYFNRLFTSRS